MQDLYRQVTERYRGAAASARWLIEAPFANARIALRTNSKEEARAILTAQCAKFLATCHVTTGVDGIFPKAGDGFVVCYNEPSFVDVMAFCVNMWPHVDHASGADIYAYIPFGRASAAKNAISLIPRGNRVRTDRLLAEVVQRVRDGQRLSWGGEGRIVGMDGVGRFKIGASLIAIRAQAPIVPVTFYGGHQVMPLRRLRAQPGHVQIRFGPPIPTDGLKEDDARALADRVQQQVARQYAALKAETTQKS
jgi:1-acyl-sn-glycerol-3-phosphate acyltransferase